jgi:hypothetical protein
MAKTQVRLFGDSDDMFGASLGEDTLVGDHSRLVFVIEAGRFIGEREHVAVRRTRQRTSTALRDSSSPYVLMKSNLR